MPRRRIPVTRRPPRKRHRLLDAHALGDLAAIPTPYGQPALKAPVCPGMPGERLQGRDSAGSGPGYSRMGERLYTARSTDFRAFAARGDRILRDRCSCRNSCGAKTESTATSDLFAFLSTGRSCGPSGNMTTRHPFVLVWRPTKFEKMWLPVAMSSFCRAERTASCLWLRGPLVGEMPNSCTTRQPKVGVDVERCTVRSRKEQQPC